MDCLKLFMPIGFILTTFIFHHLWERSRKPVNNNPVIFKDAGNISLYFVSWVSVIGFAISMFILVQ